MKPDIVFFGENLPMRYFVHGKHDFPQCDLLIVMGTSLAVQVCPQSKLFSVYNYYYVISFGCRQPFCTLINDVSDWTPRLLINREKVGEAASNSMLVQLGLEPEGKRLADFIQVMLHCIHAQLKLFRGF